MHDKIKERIAHLVTLGDKLRYDPQLDAILTRTYAINAWFTPEFTRLSIHAIINEMLDGQKLTAWLAKYDINDTDPTQVVGIIMAGNIPLVGFHDFLCTYVVGNPIRIKLSGKDDILFAFVFDLFCKIDKTLSQRAQIVDKLEGYDAVIATGSNNSHRYFEYYFRDKPKLLRRNRNSIAILTGDETASELDAMADDIFMYFGFGCRNVSKLYVPEGYDITLVFPHTEKYKWLHNHSKYMNNYDYNRTLLLLNNVQHLANEVVMIQEQPSIASPVSMLYYERYADITKMKEEAIKNEEQIQCIVTGHDTAQKLNLKSTVGFGQSQSPGLSDYADGVDTLAFLISLKTLS